MDTVHLRTSSWRSGPVKTASTFYERWKGLRGAESGTSILIETSTVHSFGLSEPFTAVGISYDMRVIGSRTVGPRRVVLMRGAKWILEIPANAEVPADGVLVEVQRG